MRLLLVEDDRQLAAALARIIEDEGYLVDAVHDGEQGVKYAQLASYDVIVLDIMLPKMDGISVTKELRRAHIDTPILLLTARDSTRDKVHGLDAGADDYMTKPFAPAELLARLRALTRRQGEVLFEELRKGDLALNLENCDLSCGGNSLRLSFKEFLIMKLLMSGADTVVSKEVILSKAWDAESGACDNNVEAYISFLRKKIAHLESAAKIENIRMVGYRLVPSKEDC